MRYLPALIICSLVLLAGCAKSRQDDDLSLPLRPHTGSLRIDGYYYNDYANGSHRHYYFLFGNGVIVDARAYEISDTAKAEAYFSLPTWPVEIRKHKYGWGLFITEGNKIEFERWYPGGTPLQAFVSSGTILNDTTFHITSSRRSNGDDDDSEDEVYHFRKFSPKPDSTNDYVH